MVTRVHLDVDAVCVNAPLMMGIMILLRHGQVMKDMPEVISMAGSPSKRSSCSR